MGMEAMIAASVVKGGVAIAGGQKAKSGLYEHASMIEEFGEEDAGAVERYGAKKVAFMKDQAGATHRFAMENSRLEERKVQLFEEGTKRDIRDEKRAARDRMILRQRQILDTLGTQTAVRAAQGIAAYEGSALNMQRVDYLNYTADQVIDRGDTADRIVDLKFFGGERAKLMRRRNSLMVEIAGTELGSALASADLSTEAFTMQSASIRRAAKLEAESARISGRSAARQGFMTAANTMLDVGYKGSQLGWWGQA